MAFSGKCCLWLSSLLHICIESRVGWGKTRYITFIKRKIWFLVAKLDLPLSIDNLGMWWLFIGAFFHTYLTTRSPSWPHTLYKQNLVFETHPYSFSSRLSVRQLGSVSNCRHPWFGYECCLSWYMWWQSIEAVLRHQQSLWISHNQCI